MNHLIRCAFCRKVIDYRELKKADEYNEHWCKSCDEWMTALLKKYKEESK